MAPGSIVRQSFVALLCGVGVRGLMAAALTDEQIHKMAKERVGFKQHAATYVLVNAFLILTWFLTLRAWEGTSWDTFWPIWPILGWGIGLAFHAYGVYGPGQDAVAREEERLRRKMGGP